MIGKASDGKTADFIFLCRLCDRLQEQISNGADRCHLECGGPRKQMAFHLYKGPLTETAMANYCFVCGNPSDGGRLRCGDPRLPAITNHQRSLGVCKTHAATLIQETRMKTVAAAAPPSVIINPSGETPPPA